MNTTYFLIIGAIGVAYLIFMVGLRNVIGKKPQEAISDFSADEAMKMYLERMVPEINVNDYRLLWGSTFGNTDINRIFAYNEEKIHVIPAKVLNGELVTPEGQPFVTIELSTVDHIWFGKKESLMRMMFVQLFFDAKNEDDNFEIWREKKDVCGNDNRPDFVAFIEFMENWAKKQNIPTEDL